MPIRLLASDLDGTLLRSDGTVSPATRAALQDAEAAGLTVVFVTGRPPRWLHEVAEATGHTGIAVAANGAMLYDLHDETVVAEHLIDAGALAEVTRALRAAFPSVSFGIEYGQGFGYEPDYRHDWEITPLTDRRGRPLPEPVQAELAQLIEQPAIKLLAKDVGADPDAFHAAAVELIGARATITRSGHSALLEISAPGITKATGLAALAARHGAPAEQVAAIGDMPNDVPMLTWAGQPYAVANAHPSVREVATVLDRTNDDDAVAWLIARLLDT
jgi:Cof subfamily protein (haloacid dehalogenase superfamily)